MDPPPRPAPPGSASPLSPPSLSSFSPTSPRSMSQAAVSPGDTAAATVSSVSARLSPSPSASQRDAGTNGEGSASTQANMPDADERSGRSEKKGATATETFEEPVEGRTNAREPENVNEKVEDESGDKWRKLKVSRASKHALKPSETEEVNRGAVESTPSNRLSVSRLKDSICLPTPETEKPDRGSGVGEAARMRTRVITRRVHISSSPKQSSQPSSALSRGTPSPSFSSSCRRASGRSHVRSSPSPAPRSREVEEKGTLSPPLSPATSEKVGVSACRQRGTTEENPPAVTRSQKSLWPSAASRRSEGASGRRNPPPVRRVLRSDDRGSPKTALVDSDSHSRCRGDSSPSASSASSPMSGNGTCIPPRTPAPVSAQRGTRMRSLRRPIGKFNARGERATPSSLSGSRPGLRSERRTEGSRSRRGVSPAASGSDAVLRDADEGHEDGDGEGERLHAARRRLPVSARAGVSTRSSAAVSSSGGYVGRQGFPRVSEGGGTPPASPRTEPEKRRGDRERPAGGFLGLRPRHLAPGEEAPPPRPGGVSPRSSPTTPEEREKVGTRRGYGIGDGGRQKKTKTEAEKEDGASALCGQNEERLVGSTPDERSPMRPILSFSPSSPARKKEGPQTRDGFFGARWRVNAQTGLKELDPGPLGVDFHCNVCGMDVSVGQWRVRCAECDDFDLCVFCFARGRETGTHLNTHAYRPVPPNRQEIFSSNWTADEEQMLLEGVSRFGLGNWNDVASLVNRVALRAKTKQQCEQHYMSVYIDSGGIPAALWEQESPAPKAHSPPEASPSSLIFSPRRDASSDKDEAASPLQKAAGPRDGTAEDAGLLGSNGDTSATTPDGEAETPQNAAKKEGDKRHGDEVEQSCERAESGENENRGERDERTEEEKVFGTLLADTESDDEESNQRTLAELQADSNSWHPPWIAKPVPPQPHHNNIQGYLPLRGDFDVEYDNHAEALLADMTIEPHESPSEKALKLSIVEAYNCRLDERIYRKRTILWRHWDDPKIANREKTGPLLERRYWQQLKPVQRFHNDSEHIALIRSLVTYAEAMERCRLLNEWRSLNLHTLQHVVEYEAEKQKHGAACPPAAFRSLFDSRSGSFVPSADDSLKAPSAGVLSDAPEGENVRMSPKSAVTSTSAERPSSLSAAAPLAFLTELQTEKGEAREKHSSLSSSSPPSAFVRSAAVDGAAGTSRKDGRQGPETTVKDGDPDEESEADAREQGLDEGAKAKKRGRDEELSEEQAHADGLERSEVDLCRALQLPPVLYQLVIQALKAQAQMLPTVEKDTLRKKRKRISTVGSLWDFDVRLDVEQKAGTLRDAPSPTVILSSPGNHTVGSPSSPVAVSFASSVPPVAGQATDMQTRGEEATSSQRRTGGREVSTSRAPASGTSGARSGDSPPLPGGPAQHASAQGLLQSETHAYEPNRQSAHPGYGASQNTSRLMSSPSPSAYTARSGSSLHSTPDSFASPGALAPSPQVYGGTSRSGPEAARGQTGHSASPPVSSLSQSFMHLHRQTLPGTHPTFGYSTAAYSHTIPCGNGLQAFHPAAYSAYRSNGASVDLGPSGYALSPAGGPAGFCGTGASSGAGVSPNGFYASSAYYGAPSGVPFLPQAPSLRAANTALQRLQQQQLQSFLLAAGRGGRPTANLGWGQQSGNYLLGNTISTGSGAGVGGGHDFLFPSAHQNVANFPHMSPAYLAGNSHPYLSSLSYYGNHSNGVAMHTTPGYGQLGLTSQFTAYQSNLLQSGASSSRQGGGAGPFLSQPNPGHRDLGAEAGAQGVGGPQGPGRRHPGMLASGGGTRIETSAAPSRLFQRENQMGSCRPAWPSGDSLAHASNSLETDGDPLHSRQGLDRSEGQNGERPEGDAACDPGERMRKETREGTMGSDAEAQTGTDGAKIQAFSSDESRFVSGPSVPSNTASLRSVTGLPAGSAGLCVPGGEGGGGALAEGRKRERLRVPPDSQERPRAVPTTLSQEGNREEQREKWKEFVLHKLVPRVRGVRYDAVSHHWVAQWPAVFTAPPFDSVQSFREAGVPPAMLSLSVENSGEDPTRVPAAGGPETEGATRSVAFSIKRLGFEGAWFQACEARRKEAEKARDWALVAEVRAAETAAPSVFAALQDELPSLPFSSNDLASAFAGVSNANEGKGAGVLLSAPSSTGAKKDEVRDEEDRREKPGRRLPSAASPGPAAVKGSSEAGAGDLSSLTRAAAHQLTNEGGLNSANAEAVFVSPMTGLPRHAGGSRATDGLLPLRASPPCRELIQASASTGKRQADDGPVLGEAQNAPRGVLQPGGQSLHVTSALASPGISGVGRERLLDGRACAVNSLHGLLLERNGGACGGLGPWTGGGANAVGASLVGLHRRLPPAHPGTETPSPGIAVARKAMAASTVVAHANGGDGRAMLLATGMSPVSGGVKHRELPNILARGQLRAHRDDTEASVCNGGASCNAASVSTSPSPALYATGKPRGFPGRGGGSTHAQNGVAGRGHGERRQGGSVGTGEEKNGKGSSSQPTLAWSDDDEGVNSLAPSPAACKAAAGHGSREASLATDRATPEGPRGTSAQTVALPEGQRKTAGALSSSSLGAVERSVSEKPFAEREASSSSVHGPGSLHASENSSDTDSSQRQHHMWAGGPRRGVDGAREDEAGWARDEAGLQKQSRGLERDKERQAVESEADTVEAARCDENPEEGKGGNVALVDAHPTSRETTVSEGFACSAPPLLSASGQGNETEP
ncbi:UNVERIFIED_CONTAM: AP2 domain transcription factor APVIIb-1/ADA2-B [Hammondia hammondi]|eukprot:XP_008882874.1 AP2 domain transcription factor APVIIb-1/ADA2-B [Hammondia hammondi]